MRAGFNLEWIELGPDGSPVQPSPRPGLLQTGLG